MSTYASRFAVAVVATPEKFGAQYAVEIIAGWVDESNSHVCSTNVQPVIGSYAAHRETIDGDFRLGVVALN